jgi:hypothetical protein
VPLGLWSSRTAPHRRFRPAAKRHRCHPRPQGARCSRPHAPDFLDGVDQLQRRIFITDPRRGVALTKAVVERIDFNGDGPTSAACAGRSVADLVFLLCRRSICTVPEGTQADWVTQVSARKCNEHLVAIGKENRTRPAAERDTNRGPLWFGRKGWHGDEHPSARVDLAPRDPAVQPRAWPKVRRGGRHTLDGFGWRATFLHVHAWKQVFGHTRSFHTASLRSRSPADHGVVHVTELWRNLRSRTRSRRPAAVGCRDLKSLAGHQLSHTNSNDAASIAGCHQALQATFATMLRARQSSGAACARRRRELWLASGRPTAAKGGRPRRRLCGVTGRPPRVPHQAQASADASSPAVVTPRERFGKQVCSARAVKNASAESRDATAQTRGRARVRAPRTFRVKPSGIG